MSRLTVYCVVVSGVLLGLALDIGIASAQMAEDNTAIGIIDAFELEMIAARNAISGVLAATFWLLATIEFTYSMVIVALNDGGMEDFAREIVLRVLFIGFFWTLLQNGAAWIDAIVSTFTTLGSNATGIAKDGLTPDGILDLGLTLMGRAIDNLAVFSLANNIALLSAAVVAFLSLLVIAGNLALVLIEFYIVGYGGIVLLALGGSRWTSNYAVAYLKYALSMGMRLFIFFLVAGVGIAILTDRFTNQADTDRIGQWWALAGISFLLAYVASKAPDAVTGLLNGVTTQASISATQAMRSAGAAAASAKSGGASLIGAGAAANSAVQLGRQQPGSTSVNAIANLAKAGLGDVKARLSGTAGSGSAFPGRGTMGGRMAAAMQSQIRAQTQGSRPDGSSAQPGGREVSSGGKQS